jgi:hypothetical protein
MEDDRDMVTIGDSFSIVATLAGIGLTAWAFILMCALLFPARVAAARGTISLFSRKAFGFGILALFIGVLGFVALNVPNPLVKLIGTLILSSYFAFAAIGASGISRLAADRLQMLSPDLTLYQAFAKASSYIVLAALLPILGWFLFAPLFLVFAGGAGLVAVLNPSIASETVS